MNSEKENNTQQQKIVEKPGAFTQAMVLMDHKIRNLEKRRMKLEYYQELGKGGYPLNRDQKKAITRYAEVKQHLAFAREMYKQFEEISKTSDEEKSLQQAKREQVAKNQADLDRLKAVLFIEDALVMLNEESARQDFLLGTNGAPLMTQDDLQSLSDLLHAMIPKHHPGNPSAFNEGVHSAAEHLLALLEEDPKEAFGSTYAKIRELLIKVHESGYLDRACSGNELPTGK